MLLAVTDQNIKVLQSVQRQNITTARCRASPNSHEIIITCTYSSYPYELLLFERYVDARFFTSTLDCPVRYFLLQVGCIFNFETFETRQGGRFHVF